MGGWGGGGDGVVWVSVCVCGVCVGGWGWGVYVCVRMCVGMCCASKHTYVYVHLLTYVTWMYKVFKDTKLMFSCYTSSTVHILYKYPVRALVGVKGGADDE